MVSSSLYLQSWMKPLCFQRLGKSNVEKAMVLQPTVNETIGLLRVSDHKLDETICFLTFLFSVPSTQHKTFNQLANN